MTLARNTQRRPSPSEWDLGDLEGGVSLGSTYAKLVSPLPNLLDTPDSYLTPFCSPTVSLSWRLQPWLPLTRELQVHPQATLRPGQNPPRPLARACGSKPPCLMSPPLWGHSLMCCFWNTCSARPVLSTGAQPRPGCSQSCLHGVDHAREEAVSKHE